MIIALREVLMRRGVPIEPEILRAAAAGEFRIMQNA